MTWRVDVGDCVELMAAMPACSVDAVVCDPPYGLEFMGKEWDRLGGNGRDDLRHKRRMTKAPESERGNPWASERPSYGNVKKNPRCKTCGRLGWSTNPCDCSQPDWDLRITESAHVMQEWHHRWATQALRVLKPGGHLLAFGGTRTSHRLACAVEDAGFEIRDTICWLYGSGFPKSLDVGKAIDKASGAEREVVQTIPDRWAGKGQVLQRATQDERDEAYITAPSSPDAKQWDGWGTALKPAHEPIVVARKPLAGTVAANVLEHGTGALNIDGGRVGTDPGYSYERRGGSPIHNGGQNVDAAAESNPAGRWPPNVALDPDAAEQLDRQSGETTSRIGAPRGTARRGLFANSEWNAVGTEHNDTGGASRFFYTAKASRAERNAGLDGFEESMPHDHASHVHADGRAWDIPGSHATKRANHHPTVKPVSLMRWLCRLITPPQGLILDPFTGSGTTGIAAVLEGFNFLGCEQDDGYADIARARVGWWELHGHDALRIVAEQEAAENERAETRASGQMELL